VFQNFENHLLAEASRLLQTFVANSKAFLISSFKTNGWPLVAVLILLFIFSKEVMVVAGSPKFESYYSILKGILVLFTCIFVGNPVRLTIRMGILNQTTFIVFVLAFAFSMLIFRFLPGHFQFWGVLTGLVINQLFMLTYRNKTLVSKQIILWK
jgi:hypothetical protein